MCGLLQMCVCVCVRLREDSLILREQLGVSSPAHVCVRAEGISKCLWLEETGASLFLIIYQ